MTSKFMYSEFFLTPIKFVDWKVVLSFHHTVRSILPYIAVARPYSLYGRDLINFNLGLN